ncbi:MAG: HlyD family secretion protein [Cytophagales bacterium]|nr:HlyD family secretion protein [Cytophagales bacterium]
MPNIEDQNLEVYSEEVQEIMGHVPAWVVRWGITVFFTLFVGIVAGSYFFRYPVVVSTPLVLTTINPPAPLICKSSGRITKWYVSDGEHVHPGTVVALLESAADYTHMQLLNNLLGSFTGNWTEEVKAVSFPDQLRLGKLQNAFVNFQKRFDHLNHYLEQDLIGKKTTLLEARILNQEKQYDLIQKQWVLKHREFEVAQRIFSEDSLAFFKGGYGIIKMEYDRSLQTYLGQKSSMFSFEASVGNAEVSLLQLKESLLELRLTRENDLKSYQSELDEMLVTLQSQINDWFENYVLTSPIEGKITLTNYWSENQVINAGERLATIVPDAETIIIARAFVPSSGLGKVETGQKVNIKLSGFPYMEYGILTGRVNTISLVPEQEGYLAEIELEEGMKSTYKETLKFIQQMDGTADIITEETRLIYRFINPLRTLINN